MQTDFKLRRLFRKLLFPQLDSKLKLLASFPDNNPNPVFEFSYRGEPTYINQTAKNLFPNLVVDKLNNPIVKDFLDQIIKSPPREEVVLNRQLTIGDKIFEQKVVIIPHGQRVQFYMYDITSVLTSQQELKNTSEELKRQTLALMNVLEDVSEEKQFSETLRESLLQTMGEGIVITNEKGIVNYVNPALEKLLGFTKEDLVAKDWSEAIKAFDLKENPLPPKYLSNSAILTAKESEVKRKIQTKSGSKIAVVVNAAPIFFNKEFKGVIRVIHDITEDVALAQQKDDFFSIASHEIKTPLTIISGNLDIIADFFEKDKNVKPEIKQMIEDSENSADRLMKMVGDYLNVSRLDQGRLRHETKEIDICILIEETTKELQRLADEQSLSITSKCSKDHQKVLADANLVKEIITNLVGNSLKFTEKGGVTLEHKVAGKFISITVSDTGAGIDPSIQPKMFERFQQSAKNTAASRQAGGTGLGLYISREFARIMGGDLKLLKSELGKGTTFELTLPLAAKTIPNQNEN